MKKHFVLQDGTDIPSGEGQFINDNQQFRVPAADQNDAGRYTCVAENKAGRVEKDLVVEVQSNLPTEDHSQSLECLHFCSASETSANTNSD